MRGSGGNLDRIADGTNRKAVSSGGAAAVAALAAGQAANVPVPVTTEGVRNSRTSALPFHPMNGKYSVISWLHPDELPASGRVAAWPDHRTVPPDAYAAATQATAALQPVIATINGRKVVRFDGLRGTPRSLLLPQAVNTAIAGTGTGFGKVIFAARCRNNLTVTAEDPAWSPVVTAWRTDGWQNFLGRYPSNPSLLSNLFQGSGGMAVRTGACDILNPWSPDTCFSGDSNAGVVIGVFGPAQHHIYFEGLLGTSTEVPVEAWVPLVTELGYQGNQIPQVDVEEVIVMAWTTEPTLADLNAIRDFLNRRQTRRVVWQGDAWSARPSLNIAAQTEGLLSGNYQFVNLAQVGASVKYLQARFDLDAAPLIRPGDVYVLANAAMTTVDVQKMGPEAAWDQGETAASTLARMADLAERAKRLGAIPIIPTAVGWPDWCDGTYADTRAMWLAINAGLLASPLTYSLDAVGVPDPASDAQLSDFSSAAVFSDGENLSDLGKGLLADYYADAIEALAPA